MNDRALFALVTQVAEKIGFRPDAIPFAGAAQAIRARLPPNVTVEEVRRRLEAGDLELERAFMEVVSVGETFFFRHPEHFRFTADHVAGLRKRGVIRAWSAGCATGEETYSLTACLLASKPPGTHVDVIGTDVAERNVVAAAKGSYGAWSVRDAGPLLYPLFSPDTRLGAYSVSDAVRAHTSFRVHNVLDGPPSEHLYDVIYCRNVLLYFSSDAAVRAVRVLASALAPGGLMVFGTLDLGHAPPDLEPVGPREANMFVKRARGRTKRPTKPATIKPATYKPSARAQRMSTRSPRASDKDKAKGPPPESLAPPRVPSLAPAMRKARHTAPPPTSASTSRDAGHDAANIAVHVAALSCLEQNDAARAEELLVALRASSPDYLPGLFELAVVLARRGRRSDAEDLMRELIHRTKAADPQRVIAGPEEMTVSYYRIAAEAYLGFRGERR